jgi:hypothetical protein
MSLSFAAMQHFRIGCGAGNLACSRLSRRLLRARREPPSPAVPVDGAPAESRRQPRLMLHEGVEYKERGPAAHNPKTLARKFRRLLKDFARLGIDPRTLLPEAVPCPA